MTSKCCSKRNRQNQVSAVGTTVRTGSGALPVRVTAPFSFVIYFFLQVIPNRPAGVLFLYCKGSFTVLNLYFKTVAHRSDHHWRYCWTTFGHHESLGAPRDHTTQKKNVGTNYPHLAYRTCVKCVIYQWQSSAIREINLDRLMFEILKAWIYLDLFSRILHLLL